VAGYAYSFYSEVFFISAVLALLVGVWVRRQSGDPVKYLLFTVLTVAWSALIGGIETAALTPELKFLWAKIGYIGGVFTPVGYFLFALSYCQIRKWLAPVRVSLICIPSILTLAAALTNDWHRLLWPGLSIDPITHIGVFQHGPFFWFLLGYSYFLTLAGIILLLRASIRFPASYRSQVGYTMVGWLIPFFASLVYLFWKNPIPGFDWSLIGYMGAGAVLSFALSRMPLFSLVPLARDQVIDQMQDGMIVIDQNGFIADVNPSTGLILDLKTPLIGKRADKLVQYGISIHPTESVRPAPQEICLSQPAEHYIEVYQSQIYGKGWRKPGTLFILHEITLRKHAELRLQDLNHHLEGLVEDRTSQLQDTVHRLEEENRVRMQVERELTTLRDTLVDQVVEQGRHISAIYDIILSSGQSTDAQQMIERTLEKVCVLFQGDAACYHQYDENSLMYHLIADTDLALDQKRVLGALPVDWMKGNAITYACLDVTQDALLPEGLRTAGYQALMTAPIKLRGRNSGALTIFWKVERNLPVDQIAFFTAMADQVGIMLENIRLREEIEQTAALQARRRLARDLHDSVTQSLHSLVLATDTANHRLSQGKMERLAESLAHIGDSARQALKDMRLLLYELRLVKLEDIHLEEAIETRLASVERRTGIQAEIHSDGAIDWPPRWQGEAYSIVMEALNNSLKYARATCVVVEIGKAANKIVVRVVDNGVGFSPQSQAGGIGLLSMAERAEQLGGSLEVQSTPGAGTCIRLTLDPDYDSGREMQL
jgi:signal transduction histidine kinase